MKVPWRVPMALDAPQVDVKETPEISGLMKRLGPQKQEWLVPYHWPKPSYPVILV